MSTAVMNESFFEVSDVSGQNVRRVEAVPPGTKVSDLIARLIGLMGLPTRDPSNREFTYHARSDSEGRHLLGSEDVADAVRPGDRIVLQPNVDAGQRLCTPTIAW